jgi:hypothetical protein
VAVVFATVLQALTALTSLNLSSLRLQNANGNDMDSDVSDDGAANTSESSAVGLVNLLPIIGTLTRLSHLNLSGNKLSTHALWMALRSMLPLLSSSLRRLTLRRCGLTAEAMVSVTPGLAQAVSLRALDLGYNDLRAEDIHTLLPALVSMTRLQALNLAGNDHGYCGYFNDSTWRAIKTLLPGITMGAVEATNSGHGPNRPICVVPTNHFGEYHRSAQHVGGGGWDGDGDAGDHEVLT